MSSDILIHRMDHLGLVAGIVREIGIVEYIDSVIPPDPQETITTGECVLAFIINALSFLGKPIYLFPLFFKELDLELLLGKKNINAEELNSFKLSRALDKLYNYGLSKLFTELSIICCKHLKINTKYNSLDTTTFSLTGEYDQGLDVNAVNVTHGYSKDHRADLKQIVLELITTQEGGIPLLMQCHNGNETDSTIFRNRVKNIVDDIKKFNEEKNDSILIADSKLYAKKTAEYLNTINFITRIPNSINKCKDIIKEAVNSTNSWSEYSKIDKFKTYSLIHYDIEQRWVVVYSKAANTRAKNKIDRQIKLDCAKLTKIKNKIKKQYFTKEKEAADYINFVLDECKYHLLDNSSIFIENKDDLFYIKNFNYSLNNQLITEDIEHGSCFVIGTNIKKSNQLQIANQDELKLNSENLNSILNEKATTNNFSDHNIIYRYNQQNDAIENKGFKVLKSPVLFVSSFFVKLPRRIESLTFIMCLSLLVYSVIQLIIRRALAQNGKIIYNQLKKPIKNPTSQWIFKLLSGIYVTSISLNKTQTKKVISGLDNYKKEILSYFGKKVLELYDIEEFTTSSIFLKNKEASNLLEKRK